MWIEAEVILPFEQKGGSSAETLNIQFPGSYNLEFSLRENVEDGDFLQGRTQGIVTELNTVCDLEKGRRGLARCLGTCALRHAAYEDFQPLYKMLHGMERVFLSPKG